MTVRISSLDVYLLTLSVIAPARVQDVGKSIEELFSKHMADSMTEDSVRAAHDRAREMQYIIQVRRGVYAVTRKGRTVIRRGRLSAWIDNRRFFLIKRERSVKKRV